MCECGGRGESGGMGDQGMCMCECDGRGEEEHMDG